MERMNDQHRIAPLCVPDRGRVTRGRAAVLVVAFLSGAIILGAMLMAVPMGGKATRVFVVGDSIARLQVRDDTPGWSRYLAAKGAYEVETVPENAGTSRHTLANISKWIRPADVIIWNNGLHDLSRLTEDEKPDRSRDPIVGIEEYRENLRHIASVLRGTGAHIYFVTTTPVIDGSAGKWSEDVARYNAAALEMAREESIPVIDLGEYSRAVIGVEHLADGIHWDTYVVLGSPLRYSATASARSRPSRIRSRRSDIADGTGTSSTRRSCGLRP